MDQACFKMLYNILVSTLSKMGEIRKCEKLHVTANIAFVLSGTWCLYFFKLRCKLRSTPRIYFCKLNTLNRPQILFSYTCKKSASECLGEGITY